MSIAPPPTGGEEQQRLGAPATPRMGVGSGGIWIGRHVRHACALAGAGIPMHERVFAAYSVGGLIGPALGVFDSIHGPFLAYLGLLVLAVPLVLFVAEPTARRDFAADRAALRTRRFWVASAAILFAVLALGVLAGVLPLHFARAPQPGPDRSALRRRVDRRRRQRRRIRRHAPTAARVRRGVACGCRHLASGNGGQRPALDSRPSAGGVGIGLENTGSLGMLVEGDARGADRHRDGRLVADRDRRLPSRAARRGVVADGPAMPPWGLFRSPQGVSLWLYFTHCTCRPTARSAAGHPRRARPGWVTVSACMHDRSWKL